MTEDRRTISWRREREAGARRDEVDHVFERASPNPARIGCPKRAVLVALARRDRAIGDPAYAHLAQCSPCYQEFRALQDAEEVRSRWHGVLKSAVAAAALLAVAAGGAWIGYRVHGRASGPAAGSQDAAFVNAELDLRKYTVARSETGSAVEPPVTLHPARLHLTILLPVGSEPGVYQVRLLDTMSRPRAAGQGSAKIVDYVTTLEVRIDLTSLPAGSYQLALRRGGEDWRVIPAQLR